MKRLSLLVFAAALGCSSSGSSTTNVTSDDGRAVLEIPSGALPDGVEPSDISITAIAENERPGVETTLGGDASELLVLAAYELQPEGTEFLQPVTLTITLNREVNGGDSYLPFLQSSSGELSQPDLQLTVDSESGRITSAALQLFCVCEQW